MSSTPHAYATHILASIHRDLAFLKDNNVVSQSVYHDIVALLPQELDDLGQANGAAQDRSVKRPPLPARKSITASTSSSSSSSSSSTVAKRLTQLSNNGTQEIPLPAPRRSVPSSSQPPTTYMQPATTYGHPPSATYDRPPSATYDRPPSATYDRPTSTYSQSKTTPRSSVHDKQQQAIQEHEKDKAEAAPSYAITTAEALFDFVGDDPEADLSFKKGDIIEVIEFVNEDWWRGTLNGHQGIFPQNYVKIVPNGVARRAPPPLPATPPSEQNPPEDNGKNRYARNLGNNVAQAATFGFGAQVGAKLANTIF